MRKSQSTKSMNSSDRAKKNFTSVVKKWLIGSTYAAIEDLESEFVSLSNDPMIFRQINTVETSTNVLAVKPVRGYKPRFKLNAHVVPICVGIIDEFITNATADISQQPPNSRFDPSKIGIYSKMLRCLSDLPAVKYGPILDGLHDARGEIKPYMTQYYSSSGASASVIVDRFSDNFTAIILLFIKALAYRFAIDVCINKRATINNNNIISALILSGAHASVSHDIMLRDKASKAAWQEKLLQNKLKREAKAKAAASSENSQSYDPSADVPANGNPQDEANKKADAHNDQPKVSAGPNNLQNSDDDLDDDSDDDESDDECFE